MTVARELEDRMWLLADPKTKWVQHNPGPGECCLVLDRPNYHAQPAFSDEAHSFLRRLAQDCGCSGASSFNDHVARNRDDVIQFLDEAAALAKWLGI